MVQPDRLQEPVDAAAPAASEASEPIELSKLFGLLLGGWKLIGGAALLAGMAAFAAVYFLQPVISRGTARVVILPGAEAGPNAGGLFGLYRPLLESDGILQKTSERLAADGVLPEGATVALGKDLRSREETPARGRRSGSVIALTARSPDPASAAAIANTWAQVFIEESRVMPRSTAAETEVKLDEWLSPTRQQLTELEAGRGRVLEQFEEREQEAWAKWDRRISAVRSSAEREIVDYQSATRRLMEQPAAGLLSGAPTDGPGGGEPSLTPGARSTLRDIVSVRAELAKTPRVLKLQLMLSPDSPLEESSARGDASLLDNPVINQEVNPLYDQLALQVLQLESELKRIADPTSVERITQVLTELEQIQVSRANGAAALAETSDLEERLLRRQRKSELRALNRERRATLDELNRSIEQLSSLETQLSKELNTAMLSKVTDQVDVITLAVPAVPSKRFEPRRIPVKVALAALLGAVLGAAILIFRPRQASL